MKLKLILAALIFSSTAAIASEKLLCSRADTKENYTVDLNIFTNGNQQYASVQSYLGTDPLIYQMKPIEGTPGVTTIVLENRRIYFQIDQVRVLRFSNSGATLEVFWQSPTSHGYTLDGGTSGSKFFNCVKQ